MPGRRPLAAALRTPTGATAAVVLAGLLFLAAFAPAIWGAEARHVDVAHLLEGSSGRHPLGTDNLGRDVLARLLVATRQSLGLAVLAVLVATLIGVPLGALPAVLGRRAGRIVNAVIDFAVAFPALLLAIFVAIVAGVGAQSAVLAIGIAGAPSAARLTQTLAASIAGSDYVAAARLAGVPRRRLLLRHVLPNIGEPLILNLTLAVGGALLAMSGLSFLGLGVQAPAYDWGRMLNEGLERVYVSPAAALGPGTAVVIAGLAFNGLGEALAQVVSTRPVHGGRRRDAGHPVDEPAPVAVGDEAPVLTVSRLSVHIPTAAGEITPVREISFTVSRGEIVGIVGESGSGKSLTAMAVGRLLAAPAYATAARLEFLGADLRAKPTRTLRRLLGTSRAVVFQDPATTLNPSLTVGRQLTEVSEVHQRMPRREARLRAVSRLRSVRIPSPERRLRQYPHQLSGGMRQRAMIAMGLMGEPQLIIADEPTSALDVTVQQQILRLLRQVNEDTGAAALLITHDIAVVAETCRRVLVMYAGRIVEELDVRTLCERPAHPYTRALIASVPDMATDRDSPLATIAGRPPQPAEIPDGCGFAARCAFATERCRAERPPLLPLAPGQSAACWHPRTEPLPALTDAVSA